MCRLSVPAIQHRRCFQKLSLGRKHGFEDEKQGNLFFNIAQILKYHRPAAFVLENVKNLRTHDKGRTFEIIHNTLTRSLGYHTYYKIIDARSVVPQHRERIFIVGFREPRDFEFPVFPKQGPVLASILDPQVPDKYTMARPSLEISSKLRQETSGCRQRFWFRSGDRH